jgi:hypothetical protein
MSHTRNDSLTLHNRYPGQTVEFTEQYGLDHSFLGIGVIDLHLPAGDKHLLPVTAKRAKKAYKQWQRARSTDYMDVVAATRLAARANPERVVTFDADIVDAADVVAAGLFPYFEFYVRDTMNGDLQGLNDQWTGLTQHMTADGKGQAIAGVTANNGRGVGLWHCKSSARVMRRRFVLLLARAHTYHDDTHVPSSLQTPSSWRPPYRTLRRFPLPSATTSRSADAREASPHLSPSSCASVGTSNQQHSSIKICFCMGCRSALD